MTRIFKLSEGYTTKVLLQYGLDHISVSLNLFKFDARCYDSAGYLAHTGIELYLKSIMLHDKGYFIDKHKFKELRTKENMPRSLFEISSENKNIYDRLDDFSELRYPRANHEEPIDIGSDDHDRIKDLSEEIICKMPKTLQSEINTINHYEKGRRKLMQK